MLDWEVGDEPISGLRGRWVLERSQWGQGSMMSTARQEKGSKRVSASEDAITSRLGYMQRSSTSTPLQGLVSPSVSHVMGSVSHRTFLVMRCFAWILCLRDWRRKAFLTGGVQSQ